MTRPGQQDAGRPPPGRAALRVIVTRPEAQARPAVAALRAQGIDAVALPLIEIAALADPAPLRAAWQDLAALALVFFVSPNAVQHFFAARAPAQPWPGGTLAAGPGPGTGDALRAAGVPAAQVLQPADGANHDSEALWQVLAQRPWAGRRVLVVRGEGGRDWLAAQLRGAGAQVAMLDAYRRGAPRPGAQGRALLDAARAAPARHLWCFSSSEAVHHLVALWGQAPDGALALASHPRIADAARRAGFGQVHEAPPGGAGMQALLDRAAAARSIQSGSS